MKREIIPMYKLIKAFPGMMQPVGTVFCYHEGWSGPIDSEYLSLGTEDKKFSTEWKVKTYFEPYVGEFFEKVN